MDLTTKEGVLSYLADHTAYDVVSVSLLSGGWTNFTWRIKLCTPLDEHRAIIVKHAAPYALYSKAVSISQERMVSS